MDFGLNEQQEMMQALARDFLSGEYTDKVLKAMVKDEKGYTPELWKKMTEMNLMGLSLPEQYGGAGDFLDLTVVLEEMGRVCFLGPYYSTVVLGAAAIMEAGNDEQKQKYLTGIAEGKLIVTLALTESSAKYTADAIHTKAVPQGTIILSTERNYSCRMRRQPTTLSVPPGQGRTAQRCLLLT